MSVTEKKEKGKIRKILRIYKQAFGILHREFGGYMGAAITEWVIWVLQHLRHSNLHLAV